MSQAATICRSNFKVSFEAGQTARGGEEEGVPPPWQEQGVASTWGHDDGSHVGQELPVRVSFLASALIGAGGTRVAFFFFFDPLIEA